MPTIDEVLDLLDQFHQRATYGALGGVVGIPAKDVMAGRQRCPRDSWIVSATTGQPTGYDDEMHPNLNKRDLVIRSSRALEQWLQNPI